MDFSLENLVASLSFELRSLLRIASMAPKRSASPAPSKAGGSKGSSPAPTRPPAKVCARMRLHNSTPAPLFTVSVRGPHRVSEKLCRLQGASKGGPSPAPMRPKAGSAPPARMKKADSEDNLEALGARQH